MTAFNTDDPDVQWGDLIDPEYIHDYVYYEGDV